MSRLQRFRVWVKASRQRFAVFSALFWVPMKLAMEAAWHPGRLTPMHPLSVALEGLITGYFVGFMTWSVLSAKRRS